MSEPSTPATCSKCGSQLAACASCGKPALCGDAWCADCCPDGGWSVTAKQPTEATDA